MDEVQVLLTCPGVSTLLQPDRTRRREQVRSHLHGLCGTRVWLRPASAVRLEHGAELQVSTAGCVVDGQITAPTRGQLNLGRRAAASLSRFHALTVNSLLEDGFVVQLKLQRASGAEQPFASRLCQSRHTPRRNSL